MAIRLDQLIETITPPHAVAAGRPIYAVRPLPETRGYLVGLDTEAKACLLVATTNDHGRPQAPIRLENLVVQFGVRCTLRRENEPEHEGTFTVICCCSSDTETVRYFLSACESISRIAGPQPAGRDIGRAVERLAAIFQRIQRPPSRPLNGLFGELYVLWRSANPVQAITAWRGDDTARFDFSLGDIRLDVKAAGGRIRAHTFSYEQCNPPPHTLAVVASLFAERSAGGMSLRAIFDEISARVAARPELAFKLHEVVAATLGAGLNEGLSISFDVRLAEASLRFFDLTAIPAIRTPLPAGVSDVHFRSDLSAVPAVSVQTLVDKDPLLWDLLPSVVLG